MRETPDFNLHFTGHILGVMHMQRMCFWYISWLVASCINMQANHPWTFLNCHPPSQYHCNPHFPTSPPPLVLIFSNCFLLYYIYQCLNITAQAQNNDESFTLIITPFFFSYSTWFNPIFHLSNLCFGTWYTIWPIRQLVRKLKKVEREEVEN